MFFLGSKEILSNYKIGFLCSRKVPAEIILKTYDWAIAQRDKGVCVISGFHSKIEQDVFEILLKGSQPIIMVLARGLKKRWGKEISEAVHSNRLLIMSPFNDKIKRITAEHAIKRNKLILELSDKVYIPFLNTKSSINSIISNYRNKIISV